MYCLHGQVCRPPVPGMQCRQHDVPAVTRQQRCCTKTLRTRRRQRQCCAQATQADAAHQARADLVQLKRELQAAVEAEDYHLAARLRDELKSREQDDPVAVLQHRMQCCVDAQDFAEAAQVRDELKEVVMQQVEEAISKTSSTAVTHGIKVCAKSYFVPENSRPERSRYFFAYKITITNETEDCTVKLLSRHWIIKNSQGHTEEVRKSLPSAEWQSAPATFDVFTDRGPGVVGETPVLHPGQVHEYKSAVPLNTPVGTMQGTFTMAPLNQDLKHCPAGETFDIDIGQFLLDTRADVVC